VLHHYIVTLAKRIVTVCRDNTISWQSDWNNGREKKERKSDEEGWGGRGKRESFKVSSNKGDSSERNAWTVSFRFEGEKSFRWLDVPDLRVSLYVLRNRIDVAAMRKNTGSGVYRYVVQVRRTRYKPCVFNRRSSRRSYREDLRTLDKCERSITVLKGTKKACEIRLWSNILFHRANNFHRACIFLLTVQTFLCQTKQFFQSYLR